MTRDVGLNDTGGCESSRARSVFFLFLGGFFRGSERDAGGLMAESARRLYEVARRAWLFV